MEGLSAKVKQARRILRKYRRVFWLVGGILGLILVILYFRVFFRVGLDWNGAFLTRSREQAATVYTGEDRWSDISISVEWTSENEVRMSYRYQQTKMRTFLLTIGKEEDFWRTVTIRAQDGAELFSGRYQKGNSFLYDYNQLPVQGEIESTAPDVNPYLNFSPNYRVMVGIVLGEYDHIHGNGWLLFIGFLAAALVVFDLRCPLLTTGLRRYLVGESPQRTDTFELIQIGIRAVLALVAVGFWLAAM